MTLSRTAPETGLPGAALLVWLAAFVAHRFLVAIVGFDGVYFWEETYRLLAAEALRSGWDIPLHDLQADPYSGGSLVFAALAAMATSLAGSSILVLKTIAIAWNAVGLGLWLLVMDRVAGRRAAHLLGLLWIFAPPVFVVFSVVGQGFHGDTVTLAGLQWLLLLRYMDEPRNRLRLVAWMAAAGFSIWFSYASAVPFVAGVAYAAASGVLPIRRWPLAAAGFAAGFLPWIAHHVVAGGGLDVIRETFSREGRPGFAWRLVDLPIHGVPVALYFRNIGVPGDVKVPREVFSYAYLAIYAAAFAMTAVPSIRRIAAAARTSLESAREELRRSPALPILLVFPLFLATIAASNHEFNDFGMVRWFTFRILVPALPSLLFALALAADRAASPVRAAMLLVCVVAGLVGTGQILVDGHALRETRETEARETGAEAFGHLLVFKHGTDPVIAARVESLPAELRERAYRGVGFSFAHLFGTRRTDAPASVLTRALLSIDAAYREVAIAGARTAIAEGLAQVAPLPPSARRDDLAAAIDAAQAEPLAAPAGDSLASSASSLPAISERSRCARSRSGAALHPDRTTPPGA